MKEVGGGARDGGVPVSALGDAVQRKSILETLRKHVNCGGTETRLGVEVIGREKEERSKQEEGQGDRQTDRDRETETETDRETEK